MDFTPFTYSKAQKRHTRKLIASWVGGSSVLIAQYPLLMFTGSPLVGTDTGIVVSCMVALAGAMSGWFASTSIQYDQRSKQISARTESVRASLNEYYGLNLSPSQFEALSYPSQQPGADFQLFGSVKTQEHIAGVNFLERTIYLTSIDGELKLSESRDGKRFKELKPARPALEGPATSSREALEASTDSKQPSQTQSLALSTSA